jgi:hypothetical protein
MHLGRKHRKAVGTHWRLGGKFSKYRLWAAQIEGEENWRQFSDLWAVSFRSPKRKPRNGEESLTLATGRVLPQRHFLPKLAGQFCELPRAIWIWRDTQ